MDLLPESPVRHISDVGVALKRSPLAPLQWNSINQSLPSRKEKLCNAFYLSPLEAQTVRLKRAQQFGLTPPTDPYLHNQSLPYELKYPENGNSYVDMGESRKCTIDKFKGDSLNSISFSPVATKVSKTQNRHLSGSWLFYHYVEGGPGNGSIHACVQNPNKAIVTINARTSEILICNKVASHLLGIKDHSKEKKRLCDYILSREDQYSLTEVDLKPSGELIFISGKVMDLVTPSKQVIPVSVWARQLHTEEDPRCLVVMEPVERITGVVKLDFSGKIVSCDNCFATLFGYPNAEDIKGLDIRDMVPSIDLDSENNYGDLVPKEGLKQCTTGKTKDSVHFPLTIMLQSYSENNQDKRKEKAISYKGVVWVFNNISGMITLLPDGTIHSCNTNFSLFLFGYSQNELVGKNIAVLIPTFYEDVEFLDTDSVALPPFDDDDDSNARCCCASDGRTTADSIGTDPPRPINPMGKHVELLVDEVTEGIQNFAFSPSPSENQISIHYNQLSPFVKEKFDFSEEKVLEKVELEGTKNEELSESSSHYGNSSKHLSCSESQDTLHSCTNSITESDLNANVLEPSECDEHSKKTGEKKCQRKSLSSDHKEGSVSLSYFSDSSDSEESFSSLAEDFLPNKLDNSSCDNVKIPINVAEMQLNYKKTENEKFHSPPCSRLSGGSSNSISLLKSSTPRIPSQSQSAAMPMTDDSLQSLPEGGFYGIGRHKDGTDLAIEYYIKRISLDDGKQLYCLWVSRDPEEIRDNVSDIPPLSLSTSTSRTGTNKTDKSQVEDEDDRSSSSSLMSDSYYTSGSFSDNYTIVRHIGKGAYGCVKKAYRNEDGLLVIAKFIRKSEVYKELWVYDNQQNKKVPLEISLLTTIEHPNVVKVLDVYENENCFQMVMEKHGSGMDLFEFIEREPVMDEPLASYIFRQIVSALSYLHSLFILHRDIKDENIILDQHFHVKLIDFGSATFMGEELFSTFCGTMEYCSPEVIEGNKYRGPELEMWALGVTLYTLIFGENPFIDVDETLKGEIRIPRTISDDLSNLIHHLLEPDPLKRCTLLEVEQHPWTNQPVKIESYKFSDVISVSTEEINPPKYITNFEDMGLTSSNCSDSGVSYDTKKSVSVQPRSSTESEAESLS